MWKFPGKIHNINVNSPRGKYYLTRHPRGVENIVVTWRDRFGSGTSFFYFHTITTPQCRNSPKKRRWSRNNSCVYWKKHLFYIYELQTTPNSGNNYTWHHLVTVTRCVFAALLHRPWEIMSSNLRISICWKCSSLIVCISFRSCILWESTVMRTWGIHYK